MAGWKESAHKEELKWFWEECWKDENLSLTDICDNILSFAE